jgi:hypothetical protein
MVDRAGCRCRVSTGAGGDGVLNFPLKLLGDRVKQRLWLMPHTPNLIAPRCWRLVI